MVWQLYWKFSRSEPNFSLPLRDNITQLLQFWHQHPVIQITTLAHFLPCNTGSIAWEQRNHGLKYESDCVRIGIGIKMFMNHGRFCKRSFCWVFIIHTAIERKHSFCFRTSFHSRCVSYENCKCPRRNYTPKRENCFAILMSVCNFHISLQFSYQFAILKFWWVVPTWTFAIFLWVCNFHMSLQFSYQFAILMSRLQHLLRLLCLDSMSLWPRTH